MRHCGSCDRADRTDRMDRMDSCEDYRMTAAPRALITALRKRNAVDDAAFDQLYSEDVRRLSGVHWTPVSVALRAVELLAPEAGMRVLDVGAGAGKLCCLGALS